jgi:hypothetical protein
MAEPILLPELQRHLDDLSKRLGKLQFPVHAYIAGGIAVNYHTGHRMSDDVDIQWSHRVPIPPDMQIFAVPDPEDPEEVVMVTIDGGFNDALGSFHPDWKADAPEVVRVGDIVVHMITPLDLAVSKLARFVERDREDIQALAKAGLISADAVEARAAAALDYYVGDTTFIRHNIRDAVAEIRAIEAVHGRS